MRQYGYHPGMIQPRRFVRQWLGVLALAAAAGCSRTDSAPPVADVSVTLSRNAVALGGVLDLTYRFTVAADARIAGDYLVFVHFNREDGTAIWNDDHALPDSLRTSLWKPGQVVEYTRTRFIPTFSYLGPATIEVGLYRDDERLPLTGPNPADRESPARAYRVASVDLRPKSDRIQIIRLSGWHPVEFSQQDPSIDWQWTQKAATVSFVNPRSDATLFLEYDAKSDLFAGVPQQVAIFCRDVRLGGFTADARVPTAVRIPILAAQLGTGEMTELRLEVDRTFVPARLPNAGIDTRELGIRVFNLHVEPGKP
jgi:hypothetical protein